MGHKEIRDIGATRVTWEQGSKIPYNPSDSCIPLNYLIGLVARTNFLLDRQIKSLENKFVQQGGYTENLVQKRRDFRGF